MINFIGIYDNSHSPIENSSQSSISTDSSEDESDLDSEVHVS